MSKEEEYTVLEKHWDAGVRLLSLRGRALSEEEASGLASPDNSWEVVGFEYFPTPQPSPLSGAPSYASVRASDYRDPYERAQILRSFTDVGFREPATIFALYGFAPWAEVHSS